jgi:hypothetical protein
MPLTDFWMLDAFMAEHPPADILVAAYLGYRAPGRDGKRGRPSMREAARMNSEALAKMPPRRNVRKLADMPAFLRTPEQLKMIEDVRQAWTNSK